MSLFGGQSMEDWCDDHGYWHGICPVHGSFWTDGSGCENCCENCLDDKADDEAAAPGPDEFQCSNCGEIFNLDQRRMSEEFAYCTTCVKEFEA